MIPDDLGFLILNWATSNMGGGGAACSERLLRNPTFALAMLILAVAAAGTMMMGIWPRTFLLSRDLCGLGPRFELLCGGLHRYSRGM